MLSHVYAQMGLGRFQPLDEAVEQIVDTTPILTEF
jgi:hypothetical protein